MGNKKDLTGMRVGFLEVISINKEDERVKTYWNCKCHCP